MYNKMTTGASDARTGELLNAPAVLPTDRIYGMGAVVTDVREAMEDFSQFFGFDGWKLWTLKTGNDFTITVDGKKVDGEIKLAIGGPDNMKMDLIQPVSGENIFTKFLARRRDHGVHDLTTHVMTQAEFDAAVPKLKQEAMEVTQTLSFRDIADVHYIGSEKQLATAIKIVVPKRPGGERLEGLKPDEEVKIKLDPSLTRLPYEKPYHICVMTDFRRLSVQEAYARIFGVERWFQLDSQTGLNAGDPHYLEKPGTWRFRTVCGRKEAFCIEIVEAMHGRSGYDDQLDFNGEGIHHIMTTFCPYEQWTAAVKSMKKLGYGIIQDGVTGPIYYGYLGAQKKLANLAVEAVCTTAGDDWLKDLKGAPKDLTYILIGPEY